MKVKIAKWGNSLAVRLPKQLAEDLGLASGSVVELGRDGTKLVAETATQRTIPHYRLEDLVAEMKRLGRENEPETVDWGPGVGSEIIEDAYSRGEITLPDILKRAEASKRNDAPRRRKQSHAPRRRRHRVG
jgi:antitoxin MazE